MRNAHFLGLVGLALGMALISLPAAAVAQTPDPAAIAEGAQLYGQTCGRCHSARAASEHTDRAWATIMAHMRVRANLSKDQANAVLAFLQATNPPEVAVTTSAPSPAPAAATREAPEAETQIPAPPVTTLQVDPPGPSPASGIAPPVGGEEPAVADALLAFQLRQIGMPITARSLDRLTTEQKEALARYVEELLTAPPRR